MKNYVSINLKKDEIVIKLSEEAEYREILHVLRKKIPELKKLYKDEKTPIKVIGKVLKNITEKMFYGREWSKNTL